LFEFGFMSLLYPLSMEELGLHLVQCGKDWGSA